MVTSGFERPSCCLQTQTRLTCGALSAQTIQNSSVYSVNPQPTPKIWEPFRYPTSGVVPTTLDPESARVANTRYHSPPWFCPTDKSILSTLKIFLTLPRLLLFFAVSDVKRSRTLWCVLTTPVLLSLLTLTLTLVSTFVLFSQSRNLVTHGLWYGLPIPFL